MSGTIEKVPEVELNISTFLNDGDPRIMTLPSFRVTTQCPLTGYGKEIPAVTLPWLLIISVLSKPLKA